MPIIEKRRYLDLMLIAIFAGMIFFIPAYADSSFDAEFERIKNSTPLSNDVVRGLKLYSHKPVGGGGKHHFAIGVPTEYDNAKKLPVHIFLHGGVGREKRKIDMGEIEKRHARLSNPNAIMVYPFAWQKREWWRKKQYANITEIVLYLKTHFNIDENRVVVLGGSDGGSGAYYISTHYPTMFSAFIPLIGSIGVASNPDWVYGKTFLINTVNSPHYIVNTTDDHLYPAAEQQKYINFMRENGGNVTWVQPEGRHNLKWFDEYKAEIQTFGEENVRNPYPDRLIWAVDAKTPYTRVFWLDVGKVANKTKIGVIEVVKKDNNVSISSENLAHCTLLLSSEHFDFDNDISITVNNEKVFKERLTLNVDVLKKWHRKDNDREMLFAQELRIDFLKNKRVKVTAF